MLELRTLGPLDLRRRGEEQPSSELLGQTKRIALLAYLAIEGRGGLLRRDRVLALFWPELDQKRASAALRQSLYVLRQALDTDVLIARGDELGVDPAGLWSDVAAFDEALREESLEEAVDLYRGDLLAGVHVSEAAPEFEHWLERERERLRNAMIGATGKLSLRALEAGQPHVAAAAARRALEIEPSDEGSIRLLLLALDAAGDRAGAARAYEAFARHLEDELGVEPSAETQALLDAICERSEANSVPDLRRSILASERPDIDPSRDGRHGISLLTSRIALLSLPLLLVGWLLWPRLSASPPSAGPGVESISGIAVLPFANISGNDSSRFYSDGFTEDILTAIAGIDGLRVISRTSVEQYRRTNKDIGQISGELGVRWILEGSVRRSGDRLRVTAQLIDARNDSHAWAETYDGVIGDVFAIQSDIAQRIVATLRPAVSRSGSAIRARPTSDVTAYDLTLRARERLLEYSGDETNAAIALFRQAIERDSSFASAHAGLGMAYIDRMTLTGEPAWGDSTLAAGRRAIALDPALADGYVAVGFAYFYANDFPAAHRWYLAAIERNSNDARALSGLAGVTHFLGRFDESVRWARKGAATDPLTPHHRQQVGLGYLELGLLEEAEAWFREALKLKPDLPYAYIYLARIAVERNDTDAIPLLENAVAMAGRNPWILGRAGDVALMNGDLERARRWYERSIETAPHAQDLSFVELAWIHRASSETSGVPDLLRQSERQTGARLESGEESWLVAYEVARRHLLEGRTAEALDELTEAYRLGWRFQLWKGRDPLLTLAQDESRFAQLMERIDEDGSAMLRSLRARENQPEEDS